MKKMILLLFLFLWMFQLSPAQKLYFSPTYDELKTVVKQVLSPETDLEKMAPVLNHFSLLKKTTKAEEWQAGLIIEYMDMSVIADIRQLGGTVRTITENQITLFIPVNRLEDLEKLDGIRRISAGLKEKYHNSRAVPPHYPEVPQTAGYSGTDVICGIVDSGIDFTHPMFKKSNGETRILYIWDQTDNTTGPNPSEFAYGSEYDESDINSDNGNHSVVNQNDDNGHGTHVAGSVCGYDSALIVVSDTSFQGAAIDANIVFVKTTMYTDAINDGVDYIFQKAATLGKPAVVNLSLGSQIGPHDGTDQYTEQLDQLVGYGKIVVRSAGNNGYDDIHNRVIVNEGTDEDIYYSVSDNEGYLYFDAWYEGDDEMTVEVHQSGQSSVTVAYGDVYSTGSYYIWNAASGPDAGNGLNEAYIRILYPRTGSSFIRFTVTSDDGDGTTDMDVWTEMSGTVNAAFDASTNAYSRGSAYSSTFKRYTLGNAACGDNVITVGAYISGNDWLTTGGTYSYSFNNLGNSGGIAYFSSQGPTRDERHKPDLAAGGACILSALTDDIPPPTGTWSYHPAYTEYRWMQGTSMSSPVAAGVIALLLEKNPAWGPSDVVNYIQNNALGTTGNANTSPKTDPGTWDEAFGYGLLDLTYVPDYHTATSAVSSTGAYEFYSGSMKIADIDFTAESMESLRVQLYRDSLPPNAPVGSKPLSRFYKITPVNSTGAYEADITLYYSQDEFDNSGITAAESTLDLFRWTGTYWDAQGGTANTTGNYVSALDVTEFSPWAFASDVDSPLPVELILFTAAGVDHGVQLHWKTACEVDNVGFEIARSSKNNGPYQVIASYMQWDVLKGSGNTSVEQEYQFTDFNIINGNTYFYKLVDVSLLGKRSEHGPVMAVAGDNTISSDDPTVPSTYFLANPYPNPFNPNVYVEFGIPGQLNGSEDMIRVTVFDQMGRKIATLYNGSLIPGKYKVKWNGLNEQGKRVSSGLYFIMLNTASYKSAKKVLMLK